MDNICSKMFQVLKEHRVVTPRIRIFELDRVLNHTVSICDHRAARSLCHGQGKAAAVALRWTRATKLLQLNGSICAAPPRSQSLVGSSWSSLLFNTPETVANQLISQQMNYYIYIYILLTYHAYILSDLSVAFRPASCLPITRLDRLT